jgi:hypothetical protein
MDQNILRKLEKADLKAHLTMVFSLTKAQIKLPLVVGVSLLLVVMGIVTYILSIKPSQITDLQESSSVVPTGSTVQNDISNWKTYDSNATLKAMGVNFTLQYPSDWQFKDFTNQRSNDAQPYKIIFFSNKYSLSNYYNYEDIILNIAPYNLTEKFRKEPMVKVVKEESYQLGNVKAIKYSIESIQNGSTEDLIDAKLGNNYLSSTIEGPKKDEAIKYFDSMFSTFHYINSQETSSTLNKIRLSILNHPLIQKIDVYADLPGGSKIISAEDAAGFISSRLLVNGVTYSFKTLQRRRGVPCPFIENDPSHCGYTDEKIVLLNNLKSGILRIWEDANRGKFLLDSYNLVLAGDHKIDNILITKESGDKKFTEDEITIWKNIIASMHVEIR